MFYCSIGSISQQCAEFSIQQNENKLHSNHSQDIPGAVKQFFTRPKAAWEENRHDKRRKNWAWRTPVNRPHCSLSGCLLSLLRWAEEFIYRWPAVGFDHDCHKCTRSIGKYFARLPALSFWKKLLHCWKENTLSQLFLWALAGLT